MPLMSTPRSPATPNGIQLLNQLGIIQSNRNPNRNSMQNINPKPTQSHIEPFFVFLGRSRDVTEEPLPLTSAPRSPASTNRPDGDTPSGVRDAAETVVEIGPDGGTREWRVGAVEINPSGEVEREWGMGRV